MTQATIDVFCDESGYTGTKLLDPEQRIFAFAAVAVSDDEAWRIIDAARRRHGVLGSELKAAALLKTEPGRALIQDCLKAISGRYRYVIFDKLLGLTTKLFEYIYEPVFQDDPKLLYDKDLHRFVGMYCYMFFTSGDPVAERAMVEFQAFMREFDPAAAPSLFDPAQGLEEDNPFEIVRRFAQGYRRRIISDNLSGLAETADSGKWTLDLGISGLWSLLSHFGKGGTPLRVICDHSRPIEAMASQLDPQMIAGIADYTQHRFGREERLGWLPAAPIAFGDSRDYPGLQLADLVAGSVTACLRGNVRARGLTDIANELDEHLHRDSVMPDFDLLDLKTRKAAVNWVILHGLGERAQNGEDPHALLAEVYNAAEASWDRGEVRLDIEEDDA
jgi:hypothetical protein